MLTLWSCSLRITSAPVPVVSTRLTKVGRSSTLAMSSTRFRLTPPWTISTRPAFRPPGIYTSAGYPLISTKTAPSTTIPIAAPILRGCPRTSSVFVEVCYHRIAKKSSTGELPNGGNCAILFLTVKPTARYREGREHHGSGASSDAADPISGLSGKIRAGCPIEHSERPSQPG